MTREPKRIRLASPAAASYLFQTSAARMRRLALDGALPFRTVRGLGPKLTRCYEFDACAERWGAPDTDRVALLQSITAYQMTNAGAAVYEILIPRPVVLDCAGDLATT